VDALITLLEQAFDRPDSGVDLALQPVDLLQLVRPC
jgi:hypothetical protein